MMGKKKGRFAVTVGLKGGTELIKMAKSWAETLAIPYLKRPRGVSLETLRKERNLVGLLVATRKGPQVETEEGILYYHPSMATLRVRALKEGKRTIWWKPWPFGLAAGSLTGPWALPRTQRLFLMLWDPKEQSWGLRHLPFSIK